ncbi:MAG: hypothetical protein WBZ36_18975 [Candidatus Nitrosopolaris sp.]
MNPLSHTLFDCKDSTDVLSKGYENALLLVTKTIDKDRRIRAQRFNSVKHSATGFVQV